MYHYTKYAKIIKVCSDMNLEGAQETECIVSGTLGYILRITQIAGIAPLKFKKVSNGWRVQASPTHEQRSKVMVILSTLCSVVALIIDLQGDRATSIRTKTNSGRFVWTADLIIVSLVVNVAAFTGLNRMRCVTHGVAQMAKIKKVLNQYEQGPKPNDRKTQILVTFAIVYGCLILFIDHFIFTASLIALNDRVISSSFYIFYVTACVTLHLLVIQFALIVMYILPSFKLLNAVLRSMLLQIYNKTLSTSFKTLKPDYVIVEKKNRRNFYTDSKHGGEKITRTQLQRLGLVYCSLCDIVRQLDESYGPVLVLLQLSFLLHLVSTLYHLLVSILQEGHLNLMMLMIPFWAIFHFGKLLMVIEPCHRTHEQIYLTKTLITEMKCCTYLLDFIVTDELKMFYRHTILNQVTYRPMQLFTLNRSLLITMLGSIMTYLVLVVQL